MAGKYPSIVETIAPVLSQYLENSRRSGEQKIRSAQEEFADKLRQRSEQIASQNSAFSTDFGLLDKGYSLSSILNARKTGSPGTQAGMVYPNIGSLKKAEDPDFAVNRDWVSKNESVVPDFMRPYAQSGQLSVKEILDRTMEQRQQDELNKYRNAQLSKQGQQGGSLPTSGLVPDFTKLSEFEQENYVKSMLLRNPEYQKINREAMLVSQRLKNAYSKADTEMRQYDMVSDETQKEVEAAESELMSVKSTTDSIFTREWARAAIGPEYLEYMDRISQPQQFGPPPPGVPLGQALADTTRNRTMIPNNQPQQVEEFSPEFIQALQEMYKSRATIQ